MHSTNSHHTVLVLGGTGTTGRRVAGRVYELTGPRHNATLADGVRRILGRAPRDVAQALR
jgi:uncharacterized protein YbjT (DUF2867 family)